MTRATRIATALMLCALASVPMSRTAAAQNLPPGFHVTTLAGAPEITQVSTFDIAPDGRIFLGELFSGRVKVWAGGVVSSVGQIPAVKPGAESGLVGMAVDPLWPARPYLYVYYTTSNGSGQPGFNRLRRYTIDGDLDAAGHTPLALGDHVDLLDGIDASLDKHNAGALRFGTDGRLYLATGDAGVACLAQDLTTPHGKILRLDVAAIADGIPSGTVIDPERLVAPGGPFAGPNLWTRLSWCYGLRNPFRFDVDPRDGRLIIGDVGASDWEELDIAQGGENFGWPWYEANVPYQTCGAAAPPANLTAPIIDVTHAAPVGYTSIAPFGGVYRNRGGFHDFGIAYEGQILFTNIGGIGPVTRIEYDGSAWVVAPPDPGQLTPDVWVATQSFLTEARQGPDGAIYYVSLFGGGLQRLQPAASSRQLAVVGGNGQVGNAGVPAFAPLQVLVTDLAGIPMPGETVTFTVARGGGSVVASAVTDAAGVASAVYTFGIDHEGVEPRVVATHAGGEAVAFDLVWRGIDSDGASVRMAVEDVVELRLLHSQPGAALLAAVEPLPRPIAGPYLPTLAGPVLTSILAPTPVPGLMIAADGAGLFGPSDGAIFDVFGEARLRIDLSMLAPGSRVLVQAYALDLNRVWPESLLITNAIEIRAP